MEALIIVDMQRDNMFEAAAPIVPRIRRLIQWARARGIPVIYACDSRYPDDSLFKRLNMQPHALKNTEGSRVIGELEPQPGDIIVEKRMLSGFFATDLDFTLREKGVDTVILVGIAADVCLLKTALDAFELGYSVVVPRDACASPSQERHQAAMRILRSLRIPTPSTEELLAAM